LAVVKINSIQGNKQEILAMRPIYSRQCGLYLKVLRYELEGRGKNFMLTKSDGIF